MTSDLGRTNDKSCIPDTFIVDNSKITDANVITNGFGSYFSNIGKTLAESETHERETYKVFPTFLSPNCNLQPAVSLLISQSSNWYHYKVCALLC